MHSLYIIVKELLFLFYSKSISRNVSMKHRVTGRGALALIVQLGAEQV